MESIVTNNNIEENKEKNEIINNNESTKDENKENSKTEDTEEQQPKISKNQQKRLIKQQRWEEFKDKKKAFLREKKKENKKKRKETMSSEEKLELNKLKQLKKRDITQLEYFGNVLFDFEMYDKMAEKEKKSLITQMCFLHGVNKIAEKPVYLHATGVTEEIKQSLEKASPFKMLQMYPEPYIEKFPKEELVYLTSESPNIITELDPSKKYIIGAIVDHNRLKGITFEKAKQQGIETAQLPIGEFIQMASRKVLAVNHVFQILSEFLVCKNWKEAFEKVIPKRKFEEGRKKRKKDDNDDEDDNDEDSELEDGEEEEGDNEKKEDNEKNKDNITTTTTTTTTTTITTTADVSSNDINDDDEKLKKKIKLETQ